MRASSCTNCQVSQDLSNYWFPKLYFHDQKAKRFEAVPNGGLLVYYLNRGDLDASNKGPGLKAFPPGLKMVSGDPTSRSRKFKRGEGSQAELAERAAEWECLRYPSKGYNSADTGDGFPDTDCESGFNSRIHMPACWDGKNLDSADHHSHVAYLTGLDNGSCPTSHPVGFLKLLYEVTWDVHSFAERWDSTKDSWPFVYSNGDPTGFSWHGDFHNGWNETVLQNAIDLCNNPNDPTGVGVTEACPFLTVIPASKADECEIPPALDEAVEGVLAKLPGCNPLQTGPESAVLRSDSNCSVSDTTSAGSPRWSARFWTWESYLALQILFCMLCQLW